jgi:hypothetical protein
VATDYQALIERLVSGGVDFLIVGGVAVVAHGHPRFTKDLDICYARDRANVDRLAAALAPLHPYLRGVPPGSNSWTTVGQPGLAYVPFVRSAPSQGRFYLAYNAPGVDPHPVTTMITQSEGNDRSAGATWRRLVWPAEAEIYMYRLFDTIGNVSLSYDSSYDNNLRAAVTNGGVCGTVMQTNGGVCAGTGIKRLYFFPIADGIFNSDLKDQDDYAVLRANLRCSLDRTLQCQ